jgi:hypothetical protein
MTLKTPPAGFTQSLSKIPDYKATESLAKGINAATESHPLDSTVAFLGQPTAASIDVREATNIASEVKDIWEEWDGTTSRDSDGSYLVGLLVQLENRALNSDGSRAVLKQTRLELEHDMIARGRELIRRSSLGDAHALATPVDRNVLQRLILEWNENHVGQRTDDPEAEIPDNFLAAAYRAELVRRAELDDV